MVIKKEKVLNAANLLLFMVNLSQAMLKKSEDAGILDLKARNCLLCNTKEAFKILALNVQAIKIEMALLTVPILGRIHSENISV